MAPSKDATKPRQSSSNPRSAFLKAGLEKTTRLSPVHTGVENKEKSISPSTDSSSVFSQPHSTSSSHSQSGRLSSVSAEPSSENTPYSHLPRDIQFYIDYHQHCLNYHHYLFKCDASEFVHSILLEKALQYEPLLFALVGFSAFHMTLKKPNGKIQEFLQYYNRSVSLLRKSLSSGDKHTEATLLTILQLAAFEVRTCYLWQHNFG